MTAFDEETYFAIRAQWVAEQRRAAATAVRLSELVQELDRTWREVKRQHAEALLLFLALVVRVSLTPRTLDDVYARR